MFGIDWGAIAAGTATGLIGPVLNALCSTMTAGFVFCMAIMSGLTAVVGYGVYQAVNRKSITKAGAFSAFVNGALTGGALGVIFRSLPKRVRSWFVNVLPTKFVWIAKKVGRFMRTAQAATLVTSLLYVMNRAGVK